MRHLDDDGPKRLWHVLNGSDLIVEQRTVHQLSLLKNHFFEKGQSQMHNRGPKELLFAVSWIDRRSCIAHAKELQDFKLSGLCINLYFGCCSRREPILRALFGLACFWVHVARRGLANSFCSKGSAETTEFGQENFADRHPALCHTPHEDASATGDQIIRMSLSFAATTSNNSALIFTAAIRTAFPMW